MTAVEQVFAVFISGDLLTRAVDKVKSDGLYEYKKGSSRSSSHNDSASEEEKPVKRAKLMSTERKREIENLSKLIASTEDSIRTRQLQLSRAKSLTNFTQCAEISEQIRKLFKEKNDYCKQLAAVQKKESKSKWYYKKNQPSSTVLHPEGKASTNAGGLKAAFEKMSKGKVETALPVSKKTIITLTVLMIPKYCRQVPIVLTTLVHHHQMARIFELPLAFWQGHGRGEHFRDF